MAVLEAGAGRSPRATGSPHLPSAHVPVQSRSELGSGARCLHQLRFTGPLGFGADLSLPPETRSGCVSSAQGSGGRLRFPPQGCPTPGWHRCQRRRQSLTQAADPSLCQGSGGGLCVFGLVCLLKNKPPGLGDLWFPLCLYTDAGGVGMRPGSPGAGGCRCQGQEESEASVGARLGSCPWRIPAVVALPGHSGALLAAGTLHPLAPTP